MKSKLKKNNLQLIYFKKLIKIIIKHKQDIFNFKSSLQIADNFHLNYLKYVKNKKHINFAFKYIINFLKLIFFSNFQVFKFFDKNKKFEKLIFTWGKKSNFDTKGNFKDTYYNEKIEKNNLYFILYSGKKLPNKVNINAIILKKNKFIFLPLLKAFFNFEFLDKSFFNNFSFQSLTGINLSDIIKKTSNELSFKEVIIPYEGSLYQKILIYNMKKNFNKFITGYVHAVPQPLPINYYYFKKTSPDLLLVFSKNQKFFLTKYLNWKKNKIKIKKSKKFERNKKKQNELKNKIFLPYNIDSKSLIIKNLEYLVNCKNYDLRTFKINIHPTQKNNFEHVKLSKLIKKKISNSKTVSAYLKKNISIVFNSSSAIFECLENSVDVLQICSDKNLYSYNSQIWKGIKSKKISENIIEYSIHGKNKLISI